MTSHSRPDVEPAANSIGGGARRGARLASHKSEMQRHAAMVREFARQGCDEAFAGVTG